MIAEQENQFSLTRAALSTIGRAKSKFLSVSVDPVRQIRGLRLELSICAEGQMLRVCALSLLLFLSLPLAGSGQTNGFTYQGRLNDGGAPATANYDFTFDLYDDVAAGTHIGSTVQKLNVPITNGLFTVTLDFGNQFPGAARFLAIGVRQAGGGGFTNLSPRQPITAVPYAIHALNPGPPGPPGTPAAIAVGTRRFQTATPTTTLTFLSPALTVNVTSGQAVLVTATITLGTTIAAEASGLRLWIVYQPSGGTITTPHPIDWIDAQVVPNTLHTYTFSDTITGLATGTYTVGMGGQQNSGIANNWNLQDWAYTTAQVIQGASILSIQPLDTAVVRKP
jgi:hypothetical protein